MHLMGFALAAALAEPRSSGIMSGRRRDAQTSRPRKGLTRNDFLIMFPKVLLGCPTSEHKEYCLKEFVEGIRSLTYPNVDILLVDNSKDDSYYNKIKSLGLPVFKSPYFEKARDRIILARNILKEKVLKCNYDYFFSLEQDVIPPKDIIERLLSHNKKIVTGVYFMFRPEFGFGNKVLTPLLFTDEGNKEESRYMRFDEVEDDKLIKVRGSGLGCILINREVLETIEFRYDHKNAAFDDMWFCEDARKQGFEVFCDTSLKCKHMIMNKTQKDLWENIVK